VRAAEILDHKADLMVRLDNSHVRTIWRQQILMDLVKASTEQVSADAAGELDHYGRTELPVQYKNGLTPEGARGNAAATTEALHQALPDAEAFHVTEDMTHLVVYAASQLNDTDRFNRMMIPTPSGLVRFEGGLPFRDVRGRMMKISWAAWCPVLSYHGRPGHGQPFETTLVFFWNDHREEPDAIYDVLMAEPPERRIPYEQAFGRWGFIGSEYVIDGMRLGAAYEEVNDAKRAEVLADGDIPHTFTNSLRMMHAFWLLLGQTVSQSSEAQLDRAHRKRAGRARIPARVTVIQLRNIETRRAEGESLVEWSHRWVVRGHPAWRACGPNHPMAEPYPGDPTRFRCRVWIAPFVKGPEGAPLITPEHVYALHR
jgi:hypothetical protein